ncbi:NAD(P)-binding protein [Annulohypoxylon maeteangense]|uniref:NAD(P)-binding protein n=1 Tax=Annulohypoxylon maeteangense TaxID=1927788 RepID=UPI002008D525|nr:NAD(P)-binding protein [Annulohypoxylon maeteangense]KAI0888059.1 NAD(P)-binding protein [Annulohypoxylon maeteangense]
MAAQTKGTILVTGGGGFVGGQIIREALESGFAVRLTARSASSAARTIARFPSFATSLSSAIVVDMTTPEAYEAAFADGSITHIVHSASPFNLSPQDTLRDLLKPAIKGATSILEAALRYGGGKVKRVVATSSFAAIHDLSTGAREGYTYDEKDWNPVTWEEAVASTGTVAYCASKALAEKAMWDWIAAHKAEISFGLATVCPPWVFGPYAHELRDTKTLSESVQLLNVIVDSDAVPAFDFGGYADSREVAAAHVRALEVPEAEGKRFLVGQDFRYQAAVDLAREDPELAKRLPVGKTGEWVPAYHIDGTLATRVLGLEYGTLKDTATQTFRQLVKARELEAAA